MNADLNEPFGVYIRWVRYVTRVFGSVAPDDLYRQRVSGCFGVASIAVR